MTKPSVATDYTTEQLEDMRLRTMAEEMAAALQRYGRHLHLAVVSSVAGTHSGDPVFERDARGCRAAASASLHMYPALLDMLEGKR